MSHCCGGCGGEDPLMKKAKAEGQATENQQVESKKAEGQASKKTEAESVTGSTTGTWQPSGQ
jgi:hypothetical protein